MIFSFSSLYLSLCTSPFYISVILFKEKLSYYSNGYFVDIQYSIK